MAKGYLPPDPPRAVGPRIPDGVDVRGAKRPAFAVAIVEIHRQAAFLVTRSDREARPTHTLDPELPRLRPPGQRAIERREDR